MNAMKPMTSTENAASIEVQEQLSALVDGELGADEARFLLRRMEHDPELAGCQERWQLLGDVMRGQASALAPAGFSAAVAAAIAAEPTPQAEPRRQVRRSGWRPSSRAPRVPTATSSGGSSRGRSRVTPVVPAGSPRGWRGPSSAAPTWSG